MPVTPARPERIRTTPRPSMSDLLASCAAARTVSTPPAPPAPAGRGRDHREAA
ncbi:hypothetical protein ACFWN1_07965 [Streptomyces sp. NPDC058459]|uniref:hypothetical protein n=1 Tax=Streptomyces sp. NPDC058459 TaxID=3346508 RepID=UPI003653512F